MIIYRCPTCHGDKVECALPIWVNPNDTPSVMDPNDAIDEGAEPLYGGLGFCWNEGCVESVNVREIELEASE